MQQRRGSLELRPSRRRQITRWQQERRRQRIAIAVAVVAVLVILAIPAYGYWKSFVLPPRAVVTTVNGVKFTMGDLMKLMRMEQRGAEASGINVNLAVRPFELLNAIETNELVRQAAPRDPYRITVTREEVDREIRDRILRIPEEKKAEYDPARLEREFQEKYRQYLNLIQLSRSEHREIVRLDIMREKLMDRLSEGIPLVQEQVHAYAITVRTSEELEEVQARLDNGEDFLEVAKEVNLKTDFAEKDGDMGWFPRDIFPNLDEMLFSLEVGQVSDPVEGTLEGAAFPPDDSYGEGSGPVPITTIYTVVEKGARQVDEEHLQTLRLRAFQRWASQQRQQSDINRCFGGGGGGPCRWQYDWLIKQFRIGSQVTPTPRTGQ